MDPDPGGLHYTNGDVFVQPCAVGLLIIWRSERMIFDLEIRIVSTQLINNLEVIKISLYIIFIIFLI